MKNGKIEIEYATRYPRSFKKLPKSIQMKAREKEALFRQNPSDPRLDTHKLHGKFQGYWAYSVDYKNRVIFRYLNGDRVLFFDIGPHHIYE